MRRTSVLLVTGLSLPLPSGSCPAATWIVQSGGTFAGPGGRAVDFLGKAIAITSMNGATSSIVDCDGQTFGFIFQGGEGLSSALSNLTIRGQVLEQPQGAFRQFELELDRKSFRQPRS